MFEVKHEIRACRCRGRYHLGVRRCKSTGIHSLGLRGWLVGEALKAPHLNNGRRLAERGALQTHYSTSRKSISLHFPNGK